MSIATWRRIGLLASVGAAIVPLVLLAVNLKASVRPAFDDNVAQAWTAATFFVVAMVLQLAAIAVLARNAFGAEEFGARVAKIHAFFALIIGVSAAFVPWIGKSVLFDAWVDAWLGGGQFFMPWLPPLLLLQWVALTRVADPNRNATDVWRGVAIPCLALCATLGLWTFATDSGQFVQLFTTPGVTFFNIGVLLHLVAIWQILVRSRIAWAWSGLIGFGCLISGFILANVYGREGGLFVPDGVTQPAVEGIGSVLYVGWYQLAPYLPIIAYALVAIASVAMYWHPVSERK